MKRLLCASLLLLAAASCSCQLFDPFALLKQQQAPSFTVTYDSSSADQSNDACTGASE
jgi:hypothetical protein